MAPVARMPLSRVQQYTLLALLTLTALPHLLNVEIRVSLLFLFLAGYRFVAVGRGQLLPGKLMLFLITMGALGNVLLLYPILFGKDAGVALLVSMLALKLMEMRVKRDSQILVFIGYFMLVTQFLYREDTWLVVYALMMVIALTATLVESNRIHPSAHPLGALKVSSWMLAQSLPLMLMLFIFFPRFSSPLWNLVDQTHSAVTGVTGNISPGSISRLSRSSAVAFRVDFTQQIPPPSQRYWRGPVFSSSDGKNWEADEADELPAGVVQGLNPPIIYSVTLEPTPGRWLYALELPVEIPTDAQLRSDYQLLRNTPIRRRIRYDVSSVTDYQTGTLSEEVRTKSLLLPPGISPRMLDLVDSWQHRNESDSDVVLRALDYFREQPFFYTLYPPPLGESPADQFLFETRRGFCEHYATSFTLLMRIAGIPARVVGGYQGGQVNPLGNYLIVRQSDAHAWSEVWLQGRGWQRVDPTVAVAPERIEQAINPTLINDVIGAPVLFNLEEGTLYSVLKKLRWGVDALNASWHRWVLGYSKERQLYLMQLLHLGALHGQKLAFAMIAATGLSLLLLSLTLLYRVRSKTDPVYSTYLDFCRRVQRFRGVVRMAHEGPQDFAERVTSKFPELHASVAAITGLYIAIRYGRQDSKSNRRRLKRMIRSFHA